MNDIITLYLDSPAEVETQLIIAKRLSYCNIESTMKQINRVRSLITGLRNHIRKT